MGTAGDGVTDAGPSRSAHRGGWNAPVVWLLVAGAACGDVGPPAFDTAASYREARAVVERGLAAMGGASDVLDAGLVVEGEGEYDLGVRLQGLGYAPGERYPVRERLGVAAGGERVVHESRGHVNADAEEWARHDLRPDGGYWVDLLMRAAFPTGAGERERYLRVVPHYLLGEALRSGESLRSLGRSRWPARNATS